VNLGAYHHRRRGVRRALCVVPLALLQTLLPGCGKKGPPLAPLVRVPQRVEQLAARRLGSVVYLELKVPDTNQDGSSPADIVRVEIYGHTGDPGSTANFLKNGTLVAALPVRRPPEPPSDGKARAPGADRPAKPAAPGEAGIDQGSTVVVTEMLVPALMTPAAAVDAARPRAAPDAPAIAPPLLGPPRSEVPGRSYLAVSYNHKGQRSAPSVRVMVPVVAAPQPPAAPLLSYTESRFVLSWQPPAAVRHLVQAPAAAGVLPSVPYVDVLPASSYNVYEVDRGKPLPPVAGTALPPPGLRLPAPINEQPLAAAAFEDPRFAFGVERCYVVRTVDTFGRGQAVESDPSVVACATPRDTFPPAAPTGLQAVAGEGAISLIWEPNPEVDLAGYVVLRGIAPGGKLERLTREPIKETTYSDTTAKPGVRYVYVIVAVDTAVPPNLSAPSNKAEEIAR